MVNGGAAVENDTDELLGLLDAPRDGAGVDGNAIESAEFHVLVCSDDDSLGTRYIGRRDDVLGASLTLRLDLDTHAHLGSLLLERLGCHEGVGDTRGAGRDREHVVARGIASGGAGRLGSLLGKARILALVNDAAKLAGRRRRAQTLAEIGIEQEGGKAAQHLRSGLSRLSVGP